MLPHIKCVAKYMCMVRIMRAMRIQATLEALPYAQRKRLQFVESMAQWEGVVQRQRICDVFEVSANHVTRDLSLYRSLRPENLEYDVSRRAYRPTPKFRPLLASGTAEEYLAQLQLALQSSKGGQLPGWAQGLPVAGLPQAGGALDASVVQTLVRAIRDHTAIEVTYQSLSTPHPASRVIWPHQLIHVLGRWHVRAFDGRHQRYADLVLARLSAAKASHEALPAMAGDDQEWEREAVVEVIPNPRLSPAQQLVVAKEYGMNQKAGHWIWSARMNQALVKYFLDQHLLRKPTSRSPVVAKNLAALAGVDIERD